MSIGHTCGSMDIQGVQYLLPPSVVTKAPYICVRLHLFRCPIVCEPLLNQNFHSLFTCFLFASGKARLKRVRPQVTTRLVSQPQKLGRPWMQTTYNRALAHQEIDRLETSPWSRESLCFPA